VSIGCTVCPTLACAWVVIEIVRIVNKMVISNSFCMYVFVDDVERVEVLCLACGSVSTRTAS